MLLANRLLGTQSFTSIEHDPKLVARCEFNKPFHSLTVFPGTSESFIREVGFETPAFIWLDYEQGVSANLKDDMLSLAEAVKPGSFVFITASAELPRFLNDVQKVADRLSRLKEDLQPLANDILVEQVHKNSFYTTAPGILLSALKLGFAGRSDGVFFPYLRLVYKDSIWMMTVGGYFGSSSEVKRLREILKYRYPFLKSDNERFLLQVEQFNITDAERRLLDRVSTSPRSRRKERTALLKLGLGPSMIEQYSDLMRFVPRYFETLL